MIGLPPPKVPLPLPLLLARGRALWLRTAELAEPNRGALSENFWCVAAVAVVLQRPQLGVLGGYGPPSMALAAWFLSL